MSNVHSTSLNTAFCLQSIDISLARESRKTVDFIELTKNGEALRDIQTTLRAGDSYREEFDPPLVVESDDDISVSAYCTSQFQKRVDVVIDVNLWDVECVRDDQGIKSYRKKMRNVEVMVVGYQLATQASSSLVATTTELMHACAQFRILIIGNSGVGKSSLITKMFGVDEVHASKPYRGAASVDQEFISRMNRRFVVHNSLGFEAGDEQNMETVKEFVRRRQAMPRLRDQLHVIWLCLESPFYGGRMIEIGTEQFLRHRHDIIGDVPLVVVITKVDLLDIWCDLNAPDNTTPAAYRSQYLDKHVMRSLREAAGHDVPVVTVSVAQGYSESLSKLFMTTGQEMAKYHVNGAPWAMATIAQQVNMREKLDLLIVIGKKKYWKMLLKSTSFHSHMLKGCLEVICKDILTVWNLYNPDQHLIHDELIEALLHTGNLGDPSTSQSIMTLFATLLTAGLELVKHLSVSGEITLAEANTVASVTITVLHMMYDSKVYQEIKNDVKVFMAYIVDLICVIQVIFITPDTCLIPETVTLILQAYQDIVNDNLEDSQ